MSQNQGIATEFSKFCSWSDDSEKRFCRLEETTQIISDLQSKFVARMTYTFVDEQSWEEHDSIYSLGMSLKIHTPGTPSALPLLPSSN